ncbi:hypothetical protein EJ06DRAFT_518010 [Trichodelitschia bisporula]|uniref:HMG box domain-containing protein n=1 Tax=Trichodelitschia bisporula TaxID=703511 RepID=A0A6G1I9E5_9PEZI|nr:hypothetical protein EJ06DRAFT_518010 [Trichodelitschia bisporula]
MSHAHPPTGPSSPHVKVSGRKIQPSSTPTENPEAGLQQTTTSQTASLSTTSGPPQSKPTSPTLSVKSPSSPTTSEKLKTRQQHSTPPTLRMTRKRASTLADLAEEPEPREKAGDSPPRSADSDAHKPQTSPDVFPHICLCQPDPKIPRPRNAFILYRQRHQQTIIARHPGLPNPEISKIAGELWRAEPESVKSEWKHLAEEEKARHAQQYPDYRFQPRHKSRISPGVASENHRCAKCGGRSIIVTRGPYLTPPSTSGAPDSATKNLISPTKVLPPARFSQSSEPTPQTSRFGNMLNSLTLSSPTPNGTATHLAHQIDPRISSPPHTAGATSTIPDPKRSLSSGPPTSSGPRHDSLRLPPLRVPSPTSATRSVEAMVMSIPFMGKIKILRRVAPPIRNPGPLSPGPRQRGLIAAVEGEDDAAVEQVVRGLEGCLGRAGEFDVRVVPGPRGPGAEVGFGDFVKVVAEWHARCGELTAFVNSRGEGDAGRMDVDGPVEDMKPAVEGSSGAGTPDTGAGKIPLLLIPRYILQASNAWASALPINDAYSPADHWQWVATLWRGIVGPDVTVYVRGGDKERERGEDGGEFAKEGWVAGKAVVDMKEEIGAVVLRRERGGKVDEGAVRRVAFEVGEWARSGMLAWSI